MRTLGFLLVIFGILAILDDRQNWNLSFLNWVDKWGADTAKYIRWGSLIVGVILVIASRRRRRIF